MHVLFVCGKNRWRSPTAEHIFAEYPGLECRSAGVSRDADVPLSLELIEWADLIVVMERTHKTKLVTAFRDGLRDARIACLNIPDKYRYMDAELIRLLKKKAGPLFPGSDENR